ncbi:hypothetical protein E3Q22_00630 [Wallemia mellicola]|uniref:DUF7137 domain-containing protein n=1 Tax=Wallemia mellicola TaxID=1708541 RepID=A0A4T0MFC1_9BASI|nr:hypothetical protein E3Q22_00630 [Wallemia mellicola]
MSSSGSDSNTASDTGSSSSGSSSSQTTSVPSTAGVGGLTFTEPPQTKTSYSYPDKVAEGNEITFGWSLTSIYNTPESLTFDAVNTDSGNTYTMGSVAGGDTTFKWDPYKHFTDGNDPPLVYSTYQVRVYDDNGPSAAAKPGGFMPNSNLRFALYKPEKYTPLDEWVCPNCSSAVRNIPIASLAWLVTITLMLLSGYSLARSHR